MATSCRRATPISFFATDDCVDGASRLVDGETLADVLSF